MEEKSADDTNPLRGVQLQHYQCHKRVMARKFTDIEEGITCLRLLFDDGTTMEMPHVWMDKHKPEAPGYFVQYEDGYQSYSPVEAFESGYTLISSAAAGRRAAWIDQLTKELMAKPGGLVSGSIHGAIVDLKNAYLRAEQLTGP